MRGRDVMGGKNPFRLFPHSVARLYNKVFSCTYFYYYFFLKRSFIILFADSPSALSLSLSRLSRPKQYKNPFKSLDYNKRYRYCLGYEKPSFSVRVYIYTVQDYFTFCCTSCHHQRNHHCHHSFHSTSKHA